MLLGVSDDTVRRWIERGELTAQVDASGRRVVDGADAARFLGTIKARLEEGRFEA